MEDENIVLDEEEEEVEVPEHLHDYVEQNKKQILCRNCRRRVAEGKDLLRQDEDAYCSNECMWTTAFGGCTTKRKPNNRKPGATSIRPKGPSLVERGKPNVSTSAGANGDRNAMYMYHTLMGSSLLQRLNQDKAR
ncbi:hypothetical protein NDN08_000276 [Rhodosorus marinus]|uniref:FLZ-type domain-containing protein n=1 Tax=Rhodosorus marinus TaxID=101924 RepID=A0AAV8UEQ5_9RHOD|nr:hypothetical protein NDN08_000276 [Rhodosorus marinus]